MADMTEAFPPGALLRDPRSPDAFDLRVVSSDDKFLVVSVGCDTRRYIRREALLRRWLLPARTAVAIAPVADEVTRVGMVIGLLVILSAVVLTGIYTFRANTRYDNLAEQLRKDLLK